jgi:predicted branched-subunit amino acid permease
MSSIIVLAGTAQFASLPLFAAGVSPWTIIGTTFIINMRHFIMGASISQKFKGKAVFPKAVASFFLIDESYAMTTAYDEVRRSALDDGEKSVRDYLIGSGIAVTVSWNVATVFGAVFGNFLGDPKKLGLDFAVVAAFMGLLAMQVKGKSDVLVMLCAIILSVSIYLFIPGSWFIILSAVFASLLGAMVTKDEE